MPSMDPFADLDPRVARALKHMADELRREFRRELDREGGEEGSDVEPAAGGGEREAGAGAPDPLAELHHAVVEVDRSASQAEVLSALLRGARRFASRAALFRMQEAGLEGWDGTGFESASRPVGGLELARDANDSWRAATAGRGLVALTADEARPLLEALGAPEPAVAALVPMVLGDRVAAILYADRLAGEGSLETGALQLLTFSAGQVIETLPVRRRAATATLALAAEAEAPAAPEAVVAEPAPEPTAPEPEPAAPEPEPEPEAAVPEAAAAALEDVEIAAPEPAAEAPPAEPDTAVTPPEPPAAPAAEAEVEELPSALSMPEDLLPEEPAPAFETSRLTPWPDTGLADESASAVAPPSAPPEAPIEAPAAAAPEAPAEAPVEPPAEPPAEPPSEPSAEAAPAPSGVSSQVQPPEDVQGPGWAFTTQPISTDYGEEAMNEEARRLARLLVTEIKLYNEVQVDEGRKQRDLAERLSEDIERSRQIYNDRIDEKIRSQKDHFQEALVRILAGGDAAAMGGGG